MKTRSKESEEMEEMLQDPYAGYALHLHQWNLSPLTNWSVRTHIMNYVGQHFYRCYLGYLLFVSLIATIGYRLILKNPGVNMPG